MGAHRAIQSIYVWPWIARIFIYSLLTHSVTHTQHATKTMNKFLPPFIILIGWSGVIKHERLKRTERKWHHCTIWKKYVYGCCIFILLRRVEFKPNELQSALNLHSLFVFGTLCYANFVLFIRTRTSKQAETLSIGVKWCYPNQMSITVLFWFWFCDWNI